MSRGWSSTASGLSSERANNVAGDAITNAPLRPLAAGFGLGGQIGFVVAMVYTCLNAMRVGLLPRFWGSLGMALGAVSFIFFQFALLWFVYLGMLLLGRIPGGRPPAWETGEAIPGRTRRELAASLGLRRPPTRADDEQDDPEVSPTG